MANDGLTEARAEVHALLETIEKGAPGASREWLDAAYDALRRAEAKLRHMERENGNRGAPLGWSDIVDRRQDRPQRPN